MRLRLFILTFLPLLVLSCSEGIEKSIDEPTEEIIDVPAIEITDNELTPIELTTATRSFVEKGNKFAFRLLQEVSEKEEGNFMISPLGVTLAFGMVLEAAEDGEVMDEVCKVLGFEGGSREDIRDYCTTMLERLPGMDKLSKVALANMALVNSDFGAVSPSFSSTVSGYHNALVKGMSFNTPTSVVDYVNGWAKENTSGMIENAIRTDDINPLTTAILSNALYFDGKWKSRFKKSDTQKEEFTLAGGGTKDLEMMKQEERFSSRAFYVGATFYGSMLRMPYGNGAFSMDVYLPSGEDKEVDDILEVFASNNMNFSDWETPKTNLWFPKFELKETRIDLKEILKDMGMKTALSSKAWLSVYEEKDLKSCIDKVFQTSAISVEEEGTEASAVTVVSMKRGASLDYQPKYNKLTFHCDHPFIYTITETSTGAILFAGVFRGE